MGEMLDLDVTHELVVVPYVHGFVVLYCIVVVLYLMITNRVKSQPCFRAPCSEPGCEQPPSRDGSTRAGARGFQEARGCSATSARSRARRKMLETAMRAESGIRPGTDPAVRNVRGTNG